MQLEVADLLQNLVEHFTTDPLALLMALVGAVFVTGASAALGYLTLGAVAGLLTPDLSNQSPPQAGK